MRLRCRTWQIYGLLTWANSCGSTGVFSRAATPWQAVSTMNFAVNVVAMDPKWNEDLPIYRQLRDRVVAMILEGVLGDGDALPSVRNVAAEYRKGMAEGCREN